MVGGCTQGEFKHVVFRGCGQPVIFIASKIFWMLAQPSAILVMLTAIGVLLSVLRRRGLARAALAVGLGGLLLLLFLPVDQWALRPLEDRFPRPAPPERVDGIVVLGGAIEEFLTTDRGRPALNDKAERLTEFVALARRYPQARLIYSGGSGSLMESGVREADVARPLLAALGVDPQRVEAEHDSRTTWENAVFSYRLAKPGEAETWLLVTSASHMPRSVGAFRRAGWRVLPWPVGYKSLTARHLGWVMEMSLPERLGNVDWAVHEWIGLLAYDVLGRSSALFPGP
jgi:uncharacterized SAM-binding protein YcdF (DUF218 family)